MTKTIEARGMAANNKSSHDEITTLLSVTADGMKKTTVSYTTNRIRFHEAHRRIIELFNSVKPKLHGHGMQNQRKWIKNIMHCALGNILLSADRQEDRTTGVMHLYMFLEWLEKNAERAKTEGRATDANVLLWETMDIEMRLLLNEKCICLRQTPSSTIRVIASLCERTDCMAISAQTLKSSVLEKFFKFYGKVCTMYANMTDAQRERAKVVMSKIKTRVNDQDLVSKAVWLAKELENGNVDKCAKSVLLILCSDWICGGSLIEKEAVFKRLCAHLYNHIKSNAKNANSQQ